MDDIQIIPIPQSHIGKNYVFRIELTQHDALDLIRNAVQAYVEGLLTKGWPVPYDIETVDAPVVAVSI